MIPTTHYSLVFNTTIGSRRSMRINNPQVGLPLNEIEAAVNQMIANDIFDQVRGGLESVNRLQLTTVEHSVIL